MSRTTYDDTTDFFWAPTVADITAPTVAEMTAAQKLTCEISDFPDLAEKSGTVEVPSLCSRFTGKIAGRITVDDATASFYWDDTPSSDSQTIRTLLAQDADGFLIRVDAVSGAIPPVTTAGTKVDVWPVTVTSNSKNAPAFGEAKKFTVGLTATAPPSLDVAVVA